MLSSLLKNEIKPDGRTDNRQTRPDRDSNYGSLPTELSGTGNQTRLNITFFPLK